MISRRKNQPGARLVPPPLRSLRSIRSVSIRGVPTAAPPLPSLRLLLLPPAPPARATLALRVTGAGRVESRVSTASLVPRCDVPLHVTTVERSTLNPTWEIDTDRLPPSVLALRAVRLVLEAVGLDGESCATLMSMELSLAALVHVTADADAAAGGGNGSRSGGGNSTSAAALSSLALLPPCTVRVF